MPIDPPGESPGILGSAGQFDDTLCSAREDIDVDEISSAILSEAGKLILCTNGQNNDKNQEIVTDEKNGEAGGANTLPRLQEPGEAGGANTLPRLQEPGQAGGARNTLPRLQEPTASFCPSSFD
eukprot:scaffold8136_cov158-Skeletonema_marinoi.AAC.1